MSYEALISQACPLPLRIPMLLACKRFGITTVQRCAPFLAQCKVETQGFTRFEENLNYTTPERLDEVFSAVRGIEDAKRLIAAGPVAIANRVYANRLGNGDEASGDGWRYRGQGIKHLTGKDNYMEAGAYLGRPYVSQPDLVREPEDACLTGAWFFWRRGCIELADAGRYDDITTVVNGKARLQAGTRLAFTQQFLEFA